MVVPKAVKSGSIAHNSHICVLMYIQLIECQYNKYTFDIDGIQCVFLPPMSLFVGNNFLPSKAFVPKGKSVIKWKVGKNQVSYNQLRDFIKKSKGKCS
jgi:hypothetical protein